MYLSLFDPELGRQVLTSLPHHQGGWKGRLAPIPATSHRIDLKPASRPVFCQPYRAGSRARLEEADLRDARLDADGLAGAVLRGARVDMSTALAFAAAQGLRID